MKRTRAQRTRTAIAVCACALVVNANAQSAPQPPAAAAPPEDGNWTMPGKNAASTRFSGLDQVNASNVGQLQVEFTFSTGVLRGHEAAPIVYDGTMYIVTPFPNYVHALDLTKPGAPAKWTYKPKPLPAAQGIACCDVVNRGATYSNGRLFFATLDGQAIALDAANGTERWRVTLGDINKGETITMAPFVANDVVLYGNSGGEYGVRGWIIALDVNTGDERWRAYSTGPDADVLIGPDFKPFYDAEKGTDLSVKSWPPEAWKIGGGTVRGWISFDPELNLIYHGTANPGPWNPEQRPATTSGRAASSRAMRRPVRQDGSIRQCRTISTIMMRSTRSSCSMQRSMDERANCSYAPSATASAM